ncbi:MAG TPA: cytochrome c3 family protein [Anaerolineae bacterium]|nr:cytochrome c3 family protein [Anaerolineae bacterium]
MLPNRFEKKISKRFAIPAILVAFLFFALIIPGISSAKVTGPCVNCHTMHNSQGGTEMATYGADGKPWKTDTVQPVLLRSTCLGCHGMGTGNNIENIGGSEIPQVYHTNGTDLAGGNFKYIDVDDNRGHNVNADLENIEGTLELAPGHTHGVGGSPTPAEFTCAGTGGCHGWRQHGSGISGIAAIKGAHHQNTDGQCDGTTTAKSYRFLLGVKGFENMGANKYQNLNATNHNEYFGTTSPTEYGCTNCHDTSGPMDMHILPLNNTISGFCATCHSTFHVLSGIGGSTSGPFTRHPTDIVLPSSGEYAAYTTYSVEAPVGRTTVPDSISNIVTPGTDVVTCLSCHKAHASNYPDLLRWDYTTMNAGGGGSGGCFTCHTQKND